MSDSVGYKRPPKHSQFKKGQSGNPTGRPKGSRSPLEDLRAELAKEISYTENGRTRKITKQQALMMAASTAGIKGNLQAITLLLKFVTHLGDREIIPQEEQSLTADEQKLVEDFIDAEVRSRIDKPGKTGDE